MAKNILKYLKQFLFKFLLKLEVILTLLIVVLTYIFLRQYIEFNSPDQTLYWETDIPYSEISSYRSDMNDPFFVYYQFFFASDSYNDFAHLSKKKLELIDIVRKEVASANYYQINSFFKREINLIPKIKDQIQKKLFANKKKFIEIYFPVFLLIRNNNNYKKTKEINLKDFKVAYQNREYLLEVYLIHEQANRLEKNLKEANINNLKALIQTDLNNFYKQSKADSFILNDEVLKTKIEKIIDNRVKKYFKQMNYKIKNPKYQNAPINFIMPQIILGYFIQK